MGEKIVFERWKGKLSHHDIFIAIGLHRLRNTRYADDMLLYARTLPELQEMAEMLISELQNVGLELNFKKTKILHTHDADEFNDTDFINIYDQLIEVLHDDQHHRYLGRYLSLSASYRRRIELDNRKHQAWARS